MPKQPFILTKYTSIIWQIVILVLVICGFYFSSLYSYILFHSLIEIFSIIIASFIFILVFNTRRFLENNYFLLIGIAFLFIAIIDILHTLAYKGMGVFQEYNTNLPTQLWIAMRYMLAISFLIAPLTINRKWRVAPVFAAYTVVTILLLLSIFYWQVFPDCFIEGQGLTSFKIVSEYFISIILLSSLALLLYKRKTFDGNVVLLLSISIALSIAGELAFTIYGSVFGISNFIGHIFVFISF